MDKIKPSIYCKDKIFKHGKNISVPGVEVRSSKYLNWEFIVPQKTDDLVVYTDNDLCDYSDQHPNRIAWIIESPIIYKHNYSWIAENSDKFKIVLTHNKKLLDLGNNFKFYPLGGSWLWNDEIRLWKKTRSINIICSHKNQTIGHNLRHAIVEKFNSQISVYGNGYAAVDRKINALKNYRFSICIENCKEDFYFSEKLMDCFLSGTIPIYWGCPSIDKFFDISAMLLFEGIDEIPKILEMCNEDYYLKHFEGVLKNFEFAQQYLMPENWVYEHYDYLKI